MGSGGELQDWELLVSSSAGGRENRRSSLVGSLRHGVHLSCVFGGVALAVVLAPAAARAEPPPQPDTDTYSVHARSATYLQLYQRALLPGPDGAIVSDDHAGAGDRVRVVQGRRYRRSLEEGQPRLRAQRLGRRADGRGRTDRPAHRRRSADGQRPLSGRAELGARGTPGLCGRGRPLQPLRRSVRRRKALDGARRRALRRPLGAAALGRASRLLPARQRKRHAAARSRRRCRNRAVPAIGSRAGASSTTRGR